MSAARQGISAPRQVSESPPATAAAGNGIARHRLLVRGVVQGVGFRPFVYGLAVDLGLAGWVRNTSAGVEIEIEGPADKLAEFAARLQSERPSLSRIEQLDARIVPTTGQPGFSIAESRSSSDAWQALPPDVATCSLCRAETADPADRRHRYPFTNCTQCGPRFTIIRALPYDRPATTMAGFQMCPRCQAEYEDPLDRRFHAQPNACPQCGPQVWLESAGQVLARGPLALDEARRRLAAGQIVALKGIGGFHLACDAQSAATVAELRRRKGRLAKPFALMVADPATAVRLAYLGPADERLLQSRAAPIVLVPKRDGAALAAEVAPGSRVVGLMLPYSPLHLQLLAPADGYPDALVMTSGNLAEEPIVIDHDVARRVLAPLSDVLLLHDREIHVRCDDSVMRTFRDAPLPIRRARGYAPEPISLPFAGPALLACGAELKNTFCLLRDDQAVLSPHIGDLESEATLEAYAWLVDHYQALFQVEPKVVAHDRHPDYLATRYALRRAATGLDPVAIQHHHAHIAACMADNELAETAQVIGLAWDGTGYGTDGLVWGGEVFVGGYAAVERFGHLRVIPLPGGEAAIRRPYRMALAWLWAAGVPWEEWLSPVAVATESERNVLRAQLTGRLGTPRTSSLGRLFDAVASLVGLRHEVTYEGQAAVELEAVIDPTETTCYSFQLDLHEGRLVLDPGPMIREIVTDLAGGVPTGVIGGRFHNTVAEMGLAACRRARQVSGLGAVCLSGGVFQNLALMDRLVARLEAAGFGVYWHRRVPANDGGLSLGQAAVAAACWRQAARDL